MSKAKPHRWIEINEDLRAAATMPRPIMHRCGECKMYRMSVKLSGNWTTVYGYAGDDPCRGAPECKGVVG